MSLEKKKQVPHSWRRQKWQSIINNSHFCSSSSIPNEEVMWLMCWSHLVTHKWKKKFNLSYIFYWNNIKLFPALCFILPFSFSLAPIFRSSHETRGCENIASKYDNEIMTYRILKSTRGKQGGWLGLKEQRRKKQPSPALQRQSTGNQVAVCREKQLSTQMIKWDWIFHLFSFLELCTRHCRQTVLVIPSFSKQRVCF